MKERLLEFLRSENKSSAQLADEIGVQPSGISHILSGRNNPSLDFVLKMLEKYPSLSTDWLLFGRGSMHKDGKIPTLFDEIPVESRINRGTPEKDYESTPREINAEKHELPGREAGNQMNKVASAAARIIVLYTDNSFEEFSPRE